VPGGASLVIYNLGLGSNDAYGGGNRRSLTSGSGLSSLTYAGSVFPEHSPSGRFHVVTDAVSFHCNTGADGTLDRYGPYAIQASQPSPTTGGNRLAGHVTGCCFQINSLTSQRGLLTLNLTLSKDNESVSLLHQVHVDNTP
jgi:MSHA biogenesis protein MshO